MTGVMPELGIGGHAIKAGGADGTGIVTAYRQADINVCGQRDGLGTDFCPSRSIRRAIGREGIAAAQ
jgi:hypothetical protein